MLIGAFGFQRSGKTALAVYLARAFNIAHGMPIYSNMFAPGFRTIAKLSDIPIDYKPKVLLLDEVNFMLDSRAFKQNVDFTMFLNTMGKQRILCIVTAVAPGMIDLRLRQQINYAFLARNDGHQFTYLVYDMQRNTQNIVTLPVSDDLFSLLNYNTDLVIPNILDADIQQFVSNAQKISYQKTRG